MIPTPIPSVIAVVGLPGTGKSEAVAILANFLGYETLYFGGVVLAELIERKLPSGPKSERQVRESLRAEFGMGAMAIKSLPKLQNILVRKRGVIVDGLYSLAEQEYLNKHLSAPICVVGVSAHRQLRYSRLASRKVRPLSKQQVDERDHAEIDMLDKARPIVLADFQLANNGSLKDFRFQLEAMFSLK